MSIQPPQGILNIPNATLRVGKLAVDSTAGFDTVFNNVERNTILLEDSTEYTETKQWDLKMPNIFVATFEITGIGSSFNFRNTSNGDATKGYTLTFSGTTLTLKYGTETAETLTTATIPNLDSNYGKVYLTYEKQHFTVTVDGTLVLTYKDTTTRTPPEGEYANFFAGTGGGFKNLKVVAGHFISDGTSNVSLFGGLAVTSNLEVGSSNLFVDTQTSRVGLGTSTPGATLDVSGNVYVSSNLEVGSSNLFVDTVNSRVGVGTREPKESLDVVGNMHLTRVSNVSQIKVDSNVVTEYTGPHDRPLRKYPEVAMTSASQGGYVVDKSEESSSGDAYAAYRAFDGIIPDGTTTIGWRTDSGYNQDTGLADGGVTRFTGDSGEWVELQLPNSIKLSSIVLKVGNQGNNLANSQRRFPKVFVIYGYNGTSWDRIQEYTTSAIQSLTDVQTFHISNPTAYHNKFVLVVKQTYSVTGATSGVTNIGELEYYGYEEGSGSLDTTLKSVYNVPATTGTQLEVYYDAKDLTTMPSTLTDLAGGDQNGAVTGVTLDTTGGIKSFLFDSSSEYISGTLPSTATGNWVHTISTWVNLPQIPTSGNYLFNAGIQPSSSSPGESLVIYIRQAGVYFDVGYESYRVDTLTPGQWSHISAVYTGGTLTSGVSIYINGVLKSQTDTSGSTQLNLTTQDFKIGASANGGSQFNGSIANFRLYSKALNADQVKELYDYQKDYFLGSKSQVTLYKGHLGVGVTEPSGQLELAGDERIQEYPPRGMTNPSTYIEGHGVFKASATSHGGSIGTSKYHPWKAFNKDRTDANNGDNSWLNGPQISGGDYNTSTGVYEGTEKHHGGAPIGAALQLSMPYEIYLKGYSLAPWNYATGTDFQYADSPSDFIIYGSKDNVNWVQIDSRTGQGMSSQTDIKRFSLDTQDSYSHFAIVVTKNNTAAYPSTDASFLAIEEWRLFGTPGPTTLDKGSLSLGRSLDVPRISRYDVDTETPRPEKLVLDFDTTVNSSPTDISGKGNHGTMVGATYSPADKAFVFDGTDDYIDIPSVSGVGTGAWVHSKSFWFKLHSSNVPGVIFLLGRNGSTKQIAVQSNGSGQFQYYIYGCNSRVQVNGSDWFPDVNRWYHCVTVFKNNETTAGGNPLTGRELYIDGVKQTIVAINTQVSLDLDSSEVRFGNQFNSNYLDYELSNPKLYSVALEASEVKKLYNLGRTGRSMVISDTAVGIGKVPEAQLDVRGSIKGVLSDVSTHGSFINTAKFQLLQGLVNVTAGVQNLKMIKPGMKLFANDARTDWNNYDSFSKIPWLVGMMGTDTVNGGTATNNDTTFNLKCTMTAFLIRQSDWNSVSTTNWNLIGSFDSIFPFSDSTDVYARTLGAGNHSVDTYSAFYVFTI
jgi:hypothetical protein